MKKPNINLNDETWLHLVATRKCDVLAEHISHLQQLIQHQADQVKELKEQVKKLKGRLK